MQAIVKNRRQQGVGAFQIVALYEQHYFGTKWKYEGYETNVILC